MLITTEYVDIPVDGSPMRMFVASPKAEGRYPGVVFYSDIFQLTGPMLRITQRLAGYGFTVAAPEIYHRIEPPGTVLGFEADRARALEDSAKLPDRRLRRRHPRRARLPRPSSPGRPRPARSPPASALEGTSPSAPRSSPT